MAHILIVEDSIVFSSSLKMRLTADQCHEVTVAVTLAEHGSLLKLNSLTLRSLT